MKNAICRIITFIAVLGLVNCVHAGVYIDDTWTDGTRTDPASPVYSESGTDADVDGSIESAWFCNSGGALVAAPGAMTLTMGSSAILSVTYFTSNSVGPAQLSVGDTLLATIHVTFNGLAASPSSGGFRIGLFDYADSTLSPKRVTSDGSISGNNVLGNGVQGYALFQTMGTSFANNTSMNVLKRTGLADSALLGTSGDWTSLTNGPGSAVSGFGGFGNGINYTLQMSLQRTATNAISITMSWLNPTNSAVLSTTTSDTNAVNFNFDAIALRPANSAGVATSIIFTEARVELIPGATPPFLITDLDDQSALVGDDVGFAISAGGSPPLSYQWYYNTNSVLNNATNSNLVVTNSQVSDSGAYDVVISNAYGSVTSSVAQLTVTIPVPPSVDVQPQDQTVPTGGTAMFSVSASGSDPLSYQWYYNTSTLLVGKTDASLTIANAQLSDAGSYSVVVNNTAGSATSSVAVLTIDTSPVGPVFVSQPASQTVLSGSTVSFTATASGTAPISYQWTKNGAPIGGATATTFTLINVQASDIGNYALVASNSVGTAVSSNAVLTVTAAIPIINSAYNLTGFGKATTGGGVIPDTDAAYRKCFTPLDFVRAISNSTKTANAVKVIEVMNDLDLGYNEVGATVQGVGPLRASNNSPKLHPRLLVTGVSVIDIQAKSPLTIFSANGSTIRHAKLNVKNTANIIIRNLKFDELWEWDESSKGNYDDNDWDFITLGDGGGTVSNMWIDHCTFTKSYDGIVDIKGGANHLTFSWCKYTGDDGATNPNSFVWQQINALESNKSSYAMYNSLRTASGLSSTNIVTIIQGHDKTHLMGANNLDSENANLSATFHHQLFINNWDRCVPRLRAGNVHDYNIYVDDTLAYAARQFLTNHVVNSQYSFNPPLNGSISTENGALLLEKSVYLNSLWPLRDNQTDVNNSQYTGKILGLDTIYLNPRTGVLTRNNSTDAGSQLGPFQAVTHLAFSWNLPGNQLPYTYTMDDPAQLQAILTSPTGGAGAGVLTWNKTNWLATAYTPSAPIVYGDPQSQTVTPSNGVTFTVAAVGSGTLYYQWYFNTNSLIGNATNSALSIASAQSTNVGTYSVVVSNSVGTANSAYATLGVIVPLTPYQQWEQLYFNCTTNCAGSAPTDDPDGDGLNNQAEFQAGTNPTNSASGFRITSVVPQGSDVTITWKTGGGSTNIVQATLGASGGYATNYSDISGLIAIPGSGDAVTNYTDVGGATNNPSRYYRIRLGP